MKQGQSALLAPEKEAVYQRLQSLPQLGGEGSGFPPPFYIACGQHNHSVLGIDIGSEYIRVSTLQDDCVSDLIEPVSADLSLSINGFWVLDSALPGKNAMHKRVVQTLRTKLGTSWSKEFAGQAMSAEDLTRIQLHYLVALAKQRTNAALRDVVLTVPASYTSIERKLLKIAAEDCGLSVVLIINEPTAVALAHHMEEGLEDGNHIIFHMGAATCSATVYSISNGILEIKATSAESTLGGNDFDQILVKYLVDRFKEEFGRMPLLDEKTLAVFKRTAQTIKHDFVMTNRAFFTITNLALAGPEGGYARLERARDITFSGSVTRPQFTLITESLIERAKYHIEQAIEKSRIAPESIKSTILCGGATQLPTLKDALREIENTGRLERLDNGMLASRGAAMQASLICQTVKQLVVWDLLTKPISIASAGGEVIPLISANTPLPVTAYAKLEIIDNTINARLIQGDSEDCKNYTDIVINNCPPCTNGEHKVELAVRVSQDGIITYGARHIGLDVALLVTPLNDEKRRYQGDLDYLLNNAAADIAGTRAKKLARTCNISLGYLPNVLRAMGYSPEQIVSGEAIELALRHLKMERRRKKNQSQSENIE